MKKSLNYLVVGIFIVGIFSLASCASNPTAAQTEEFRKTVEEIFDLWGTANLTEDADLYVSLWDEDYVKLAAGKDPRMGLDVLRESKINGWKKWKYETFEVNIEEVQLAGEFGWGRGTYVVTSRPAGGGDLVVSEGTFLTVFKKQSDGSWLAYRDTMMPAPAK